MTEKRIHFCSRLPHESTSIFTGFLFNFTVFVYTTASILELKEKRNANNLMCFINIYKFMCARLNTFRKVICCTPWQFIFKEQIVHR